MLNGFYHIKASVLVTSAIIVFAISYGLYYLFNAELQEELSNASNDTRVNDSTSIADAGGNNSFAFIDTEGKNSSKIIDKGDNNSSAIIDKDVNTLTENIDPKVENEPDSSMPSKMIAKVGENSSVIIDKGGNKTSEAIDAVENASSQETDTTGNETSATSLELKKESEKLSKDIDSTENRTSTINPGANKFSEIVDAEKNITVTPTVMSTDQIIPTISHLNETVKIPKEFDARQKWTNCPSIGKVWDQGACSCCWAISAASVMTDRLCIKSNGKIQTVLSPQYLISSCVNCTKHNGGNGCNGGDSNAAFKFWISNGLVSGGDYDSHNNCLPFFIAPCIHNSNQEQSDSNAKRQLCKKNETSPKINNTCINNGKPISQEDKYHGDSMYYLDSVETIQKEILLNGPVQAKFFYEDSFSSFTGEGLYDCHTEMKNEQIHSVKIIGWNETEKNIPYWLCVNSYNTDWGDKGLFRIERGKNLCKIEGSVLTGEAKFPTS